MKSILLSIRPEWVAKILNREKTIEIRKKFPKDYVGWVYIYCTKDNKHKLEYTELNGGNWSANDGGDRYNGKVVARFWCDKVERFYNAGQCIGEEPNDIINIICNNACISRDNLDDYCEGNYFYTIHISKLEVFDIPKELSEFVCACPTEKCCKCKYAKFMCGQVACDKPRLTKAPQNYCYIESEK